jgi:copper chaperone
MGAKCGSYFVTVPQTFMEKLHLEIEGMHCGGCATGIQMVTSNLDGVSSSFVDLDGKFADIEMDPEKVDKAKIVSAIEELGYKAS